MDIEFTIQQVAKETGVSEYTLRYYENIGLMMNVKRAENGHRRYSVDDIEWISFLKQLKATGMPLKKIRAFAALRREGIQTSKQRREMLEAHRDEVLQQIEMLHDCLKVIDYKIQRHRKNEANLSIKTK